MTQGSRKSKTKPEVSKRKKKKIKAEINELGNRDTMEKINKTQSWLFEKVNKIHKPLATRRIKGGPKSIMNEKGDRTKDHKRPFMNNCMPTHWTNYQKHNL